MKKYIILFSAIILAISFSACGSQTSLNSDVSSVSSKQSSSQSSSKVIETKTSQSSAIQTESKNSKVESSKIQDDTNNLNKSKMLEDAKNAMINPNPNSQSRLWTQTFFNKINLSDLYDKAVENGKADNVNDFTEFVYNNTSAPSNWKELFENEFHESYPDKIDKYEDLGNNEYQIYVTKEGKSVPFVTVNSVTGYYHG